MCSSQSRFPFLTFTLLTGVLLAGVFSIRSAGAEVPLLRSVPLSLSGTVFPAFTDAPSSNPAGLRNEEAVGVSAAFAPYANGNSGFASAGAAWGNNRTGLGAQILSSSSANSTVDPTTGLVTSSSWGVSSIKVGGAMGTGSLGAGTTLSFSPVGGFTGLDLGLHFGRTSGAVTGLVFRNVTSFTSTGALAFGLGWAEPELFTVELDVITPTLATLSINPYTVALGSTVRVKRMGFGFEFAYSYAQSTGFSSVMSSQLHWTWWLMNSMMFRFSVGSTVIPTVGLTFAFGGK